MCFHGGVIIPFTSEKPIPNLEVMLQKQRQYGGKIVRYQRLFSLLVYSQHYSEFEWLEPSASRQAAGLKHALFCFVFGWWSAHGLLRTFPAIVVNLLGGTDVTRLLTASTPEELAAADLDMEIAQKREHRILLGCILFLFLLMLAAFAPVIKKIAKGGLNLHELPPPPGAARTDAKHRSHAFPLELLPDAGRVSA